MVPARAPARSAVVKAGWVGADIAGALQNAGM